MIGGYLAKFPIRTLGTMTEGAMVKAVQSIFPKMEQAMHKGQCGKIAVIGGSEEYTGAPYFSAISALKVGADLAHVFCAERAAPVIKSYSPELIVHPNISQSLDNWLDKFHAVVLGPGLGRDQTLLAPYKDYVEKIKNLDLPLVIDADGLYFIEQCLDLITCYKKAVLTPNIVEFKRMYRRVFSAEPSMSDTESGHAVKKLAEQLGNVTVVQKGPRDLISNGSELLVCDHVGSARRCGGQGDLLSGSLATLSCWAHKAVLCSPKRAELERYGPSMIAAYAACLLTRQCASMAFKQLGRTTTTSDLINSLPSALDSFGVLY